MDQKVGRKLMNLKKKYLHFITDRDVVTNLEKADSKFKNENGHALLLKVLEANPTDPALSIKILDVTEELLQSYMVKYQNLKNPPCIDITADDEDGYKIKRPMTEQIKWREPVKITFSENPQRVQPKVPNQQQLNAPGDARNAPTTPPPMFPSWISFPGLTPLFPANLSLPTFRSKLENSSNDASFHNSPVEPTESSFRDASINAERRQELEKEKQREKAKAEERRHAARKQQLERYYARENEESNPALKSILKKTNGKSVARKKSVSFCFDEIPSSYNRDIENPLHKKGILKVFKPQMQQRELTVQKRQTSEEEESSMKKLKIACGMSDEYNIGASTSKAVPIIAASTNNECHAMEMDKEPAALSRVDNFDFSLQR